MHEPENTTLVYDGKIVWLESRIDKETIEVTKIRGREIKKTIPCWRHSLIAKISYRLFD